MPSDPPPYYVSGYYMDFNSVHALMSKLGIHDRGMRDAELYHPVNNWLAEHGKKDILACTMPHPIKATSWEEDGMIIMTHIILCDAHLVLPECDEKDEKVKRWLVDECGLKPDELEWHRFFDKYWLTINGTEPRTNDRRRRPDPVFVTDEDADEWERVAPHLTINEFIAMRQEKERAEK